MRFTVVRTLAEIPFDFVRKRVTVAVEDMEIASVFLPFLPLTGGQILLNKFPWMTCLAPLPTG